MKFCPNCDIRLVKTSDNTVLSCPKCTYSEGDDTKPEKQSTEEEPQTDFMVLEKTIRYAVIMISTLPILLVYPFVQKYFVKGVMIGAIKG